MIYIILASHGDLAHGILNSAEVIAGPQKNITSFVLNPGDSIDEFSQKLRHEIKTHSTNGDHVLVLTDLFGGSPTNSVIAAMQDLKFNCFAGMNLPMVFRKQHWIENSQILVIANIFKRSLLQHKKALLMLIRNLLNKSFKKWRISLCHTKIISSSFA